MISTNILNYKRAYIFSQKLYQHKIGYNILIFTKKEYF